MTIKTVSRDELKEIANDLFRIVISDLRDEISAINRELTHQHESLITLNTQINALEHQTKTESHRAKRARDSIFERMAKLENDRG